MVTKEKLEASLRDAMRAHDDVRKRTLRMSLAAIRLAEIDKRSPIDENSIVAILQKEIKIRREVIQDAEKANRPDLINAASEEIAVLESFLPQQLSPAELEALVEAAIAEAGAKSPTDMGKVMKILLPRIEGRAPNDQVSLAVRQKLQTS